MKFSNLFTMISTQWAAARGNEMAYLILGEPGGGKSALARALVRHMGGTPENTVEFTPSLRDPVDVLGTPRNNGSYTEWVPPAEFYKLRHVEGDKSPKFLIIEEMTDAQAAMQNPMCRIILDRYAGDLRLSDNLYIIATGNRTEDQSGASRLTTKLGNRLNIQHFQSNLDDWANWAIDNNVDPTLVSFIRYKPELLSKFDPKVPYGVNPTPRSWEKVALCPTSLPDGLYHSNVSGLVGEGAASEYVGFRRVHAELVAFEDILKAPKTAKLPKELSAQYAMVGMLSFKTTAENVDTVTEYVTRLNTDFQVMYWQDTMRRCPQVKTSKALLAWARSGNNVLMG